MKNIEDIKSGDYIRTIDGKIYTVTNVYVLKVTCGHTTLRYSQIKCCSSRLVGILETGDYVNGMKVTDIVMCQPKMDGNHIYTIKFGNIGICDSQIEDVVTHEQFNKGKYIVGGEK